MSAYKASWQLCSGMIDGTIGLTDQQGGVKIGAENTIVGQVN